MGNFKTSVGGQALIEGIMMKGPSSYSVAVRNPEGEIEVSVTTLVKRPWAKLPFIRGTFTFVDTLILGYGCLMKSAEIAMTQEEQEQAESRFELWLKKTFGDKANTLIMAFAAILGGGLAIGLFMVLPTLITSLVAKYIAVGSYKTVLEGVIKIVIFIAYLAAVSQMKDIKRVFSYHGAEHKTISCYEAGEELTVENILKHSRFHPRCGTSFMLIVLVVSIIVFSALPWSSAVLRILLKLVLLPVVVGISYEIIKFAGKHDNIATRIISAPGMWLQRLTTVEPTADMIEVAIASVLPVLPQNKEEGSW